MPANNPPSARRKIATRGGTAVIVASSTILGFLHDREDGGKTINVVYADKLAGGLPTACGGLTKFTSPVPVVVGEYWSDEKCAEMTAYVIARTQTTLAACIRGRVTQNAFDALSSHAHNFGVGATCGSQSVALINAGNMTLGCQRLSVTAEGEPNWSHIRDAAGVLQYYRGLNNRRRAETALCLKPDEAPGQ